MEEKNEVEFDYEYHENGANISHFFVDPDHREEGRGKAVLEELIDKFRQDDLDYVVVNMKGGKTAQSFLRSNKFEIVEVQGKHITGEKEL